jgi:hypothetical protein
MTQHPTIRFTRGHVTLPVAQALLPQVLGRIADHQSRAAIERVLAERADGHGVELARDQFDALLDATSAWQRKIVGVMSDQTRVVHVRDNVPGAIYIGRRVRKKLPQSPFVNPFVIGRIWGDRAQVVANYRQYLMTGPGRPLLVELPALRGRPLACWCRHDGEVRTPRTVCHGDVLVSLLNAYTDDELRAMGAPS